MPESVKRIVLDLNSIRAMEQAAGLTRAKAKTLQAFPKDILPQVAKAVQVRSIDPLLHRLRIYPPRPVYPIVWKSEKQRRYVLMMLRREGNLPYQRTGDLARGWRGVVSVTPRQDGIRILVENVARSGGKRYARFVGGSIGVGISARSLERYKAPIQPFHARTGWQPFAPLVARYYEDARREATARYQARLQRLLSE